MTFNALEESGAVPLSEGFLESEAPDALRAIVDAKLNVVVWRRLLRPTVARALGRWILHDDLAIDSVIDANEDAVHRALSGLPAGAPQAFLRADVGKLAALFADLCDVRRVRLVLAIRRDDACRKFHTDNVRLRLITTYVGPGTEWIANPGVNRAVLAQAPLCPDEANRLIAIHPNVIRRARPGNVLLLKGDREAGTLGAVHRSPPIEQYGLTRLVLSLTTVSA